MVEIFSLAICMVLYATSCIVYPMSRPLLFCTFEHLLTLAVVDGFLEHPACFVALCQRAMGLPTLGALCLSPHVVESTTEFCDILIPPVALCSADTLSMILSSIITRKESRCSKDTGFHFAGDGSSSGDHYGYNSQKPATT